MKGNTELSQFVKQLKRELIAAQEKDSDPSFKLDEVELEVSFVIDGSGKAKPKLLVVDNLADTKALQVHKARLRFTPLPSGKKKKEKRKHSFGIGNESDYFE